MNRTQKRLWGSFALSCVCALSSHLWYKSASRADFDAGDRQPIAQLVELSNEVQRKPSKRLIWQSLSENDQLFSGEQIRTTQNSEAKIQIVKTGTIISLEPDSLITLDEKDGQLSLDFLQGNLFVKGGEGTDSLKLKTGGKEIAIGGADVSLGKSQGGDLDVQVFKGSVNGVVASEDPFQITFPGPQAEVHVSPDGKEAVTFEFKRQFAQGTNFVLETGRTRSDLKANPQTTQVNSQKLASRLEPGDYFWRLVATDPADPSKMTTSGVYRVRVLPKRPPIPLFPEKEQSLAMPEDKSTVSFRWANPGKLKDLVLEVATSADFKQDRREVRLKGQDFTELELNKSGRFFWRVTGFLKGNEPVASPVQTFTLKVGGEVAQPVLEFPRKGEKVSFSQMRTRGVGFQWKASGLAKGYRVKLVAKNSRDPAAAKPREEESVANSFKVTNLPPGQYEWSVTAVGPDGKPSKASETWQFSVEDLPTLAWKDQEKVFFYEGETPELKVEWVPLQKGASKYRLIVQAEDLEPVSSEAVGASGALVVPKAGRYQAVVEALGPNGEVMAKSSERILEVKPAPLLPAPTFAERLANPLKSSRRGDVDLEWNSIEGASSYVVEIQNVDGSVVKEEATKSSRMSVRKLKPGELRVQVRALDSKGRRGVASEARPLLVPDSSDVRAPKMMKIKVQ